MVPVLHFYDAQLQVQLFIVFVKKGHLARSEAVAHRHPQIRRESAYRELKYRAFHRAAYGVWAVKHHEFQSGRGGFLHGVAHGGEIGIEARAYVLYVKNQNIQVL